jgi:hypothetical protein
MLYILRSLHEAASQLYTFRDYGGLRVLPGHLLLELQSSLYGGSQMRSQDLASFLTVPSTVINSDAPSSGSVGVATTNTAGVKAGLCYAPTAVQRRDFIRTLSAALDHFMRLWKLDYTLSSQ